MNNHIFDYPYIQLILRSHRIKNASLLFKKQAGMMVMRKEPKVDGL
jgi:hypothetical protein